MHRTETGAECILVGFEPSPRGRGRSGQMATFDDSLFGRVHVLTAGFLEGTLGPDERCEFESLLSNSAAARRVYLEYVQETACLRWLCVEEFPNVVELAKPADDDSQRVKSRRRR